MLSRSSSQRPPLVGDFVPKRPTSKGTPPILKRKFSETECDTLDLAIEEMSDDALGRFWGMYFLNALSTLHLPIHLLVDFAVAFVLLDIIRKSKFRIPDEPLARLQNRNILRVPSKSNIPSGSSTAQPGSASRSNSKYSSRWSIRSGTGKLKDLTIGMMLQPRRWSL
jgi:hypothetical protein